MKSKLWRSLAGGVAVMVGATSIVSAQSSSSGLPNTGWYTTAVIQNLSDSAQADVVLSAFDAGSTSSAALTASTPIAAGANVVFRPDNPGTAGTIGIQQLGANFFGSMVISSLEPLAAVAKVTNVQLNTLGVAGGAANAEYQGSSEGATTLLYPNVKNRFNNFTSVFYIQSVGSNGTFTATVRTPAPDSKTYSKSFNVAANRTTVVQVGELLLNGTGATWGSQAPVTGNTCRGRADSAAASPCFGALTISSSTPVVGTSVQYQTNQTPVKQANASALFAADEGATRVSCPLYKSLFPARATNFSGVQVQNVTNAPININVTLRGNAQPASNPAANRTYAVSFTNVGAGESRVVSRNIGAGNFPDGGVGSVTIEATGDVIAASTEDSGTADRGTSTIYNCFAAEDGTAKLSFPSAKRDFPSATNAGANNTGINIQNISTTATATISARYVCRNNVTATIPSELAPGASVSFFQNNPQSGGLIPANSICAVTVTATDKANPSAGVPIVGLSNESVEGLSAPSVTFRDSNNYEGFNQ